jgi:hypothetical protein
MRLSLWRLESPFDNTYHGKRHDAVGQEVVVKTREVCAATSDKLQRQFSIQAKSIVALNGAEHLLFLLLDLLRLRGQVLDDRGWFVERGQGRDIAQGNPLGKSLGGRAGQELLVC